MPARDDFDQGHGVRFEKVIVRQIRALAAEQKVNYSEMVRTLMDEALLARLSRPTLDRGTLREAVLHAIEHRESPPETPKEPDLYELLWDEYTAMMQEEGEWD